MSFSASTTPAVSPHPSPKVPKSKKTAALSVEEQETERLFVSLAETVIKSNHRDDQKYFVITYWKHATVDQLLAIWQRLLNSSEHSQKAYNFLSVWLEHGCETDFPPKRVGVILDILQKTKIRDTNDIKLLLLKLNARKIAAKTIPTFQKKAKSLRQVSEMTHLDIVSLDCDDIAKILTQQEFELFASVLPSDFMIKIGWSNKAEKKSAAISRLISRFNQISSWVTTEILLKTDRKGQLIVVEKFIKVAKSCERMNNFNSLMEILAGLNNFAVQRIKEMWKQIPQKYERIFQELEQLMDAHQNFKNYTQELAERKPPVLPYFGLFLRDFVVLSEGNPIVREDGSLNFELMRLLGQRTETIQKYQVVPYKLEQSKPAVHYMANMYCIDDEDLLYKFSLKCEPAHDVEESVQPSPPSRPELVDEEDPSLKGEERRKFNFNISERFLRLRSGSILGSPFK